MRKQNQKRLSPWIGKSLLLCAVAAVLFPALLVRICVPDTVRVLEGESGESWPFSSLFQIEVAENEWVTVSENKIEQNHAIEGSRTGVVQTQAEINLWGMIPLKSVAVEVWQQRELLAGGHTIGIDLYTDGILVLGTGKVETAQGEENSPARGILYEGDKIRRVNGQEVSTVEQVDALVQQSGGEPVTLELTREDQTLEVSVTPKIDQEGRPRIGIWIRDRAQGLGTLTFVDPETQHFGSVGHGISDVDTGDILPIQDGLITQAKIRHLVKGEEGEPGEVEGSLTGLIWGQVRRNSESGIYGHYTGDEAAERYPIALKGQVENGEAVILSDILDGEIQSYQVQVEKASGLSNFNHGMVVTITDERLLQETGGIIQGMSGCPIVQNGHLIGAVTHVFVKDPTKGYGIYIEDMLQEADRLN